MKKKTIIIIIVSALVVAGLVYGIVSAQQNQQASNDDLQTFEISYGPLSAVVDETGEVYADQTAILFWETKGIVGEINVELGEEVVAGQILATLNENSLPQTIYLAQQDLINSERALENLYEGAAESAAISQLAVANARDALDSAEYRWTLNQPGNRASDEELKSAKAKKTIAEKQLTQKQKEYDNASGSIAKAKAQINLTAAINQRQYAVWYLNWLQDGGDEIEMAIFDANVAVGLANLEAAEREYNRVKDGPDPDDISMAEARIAAAQASLDMTSITAPFGGVITSVDVLPGDLVVPNTLAFRIDNLYNLLVDVGVSEIDINQIKVGQPVTLSFDAVLGKEYQGEIVEVSPVGVLQQGLVSFEVTIELLDADEDVRPGLTAAVAIVVRQVEDALLIPNRAVRWVKGEQVVYLATDPDIVNAENLLRVLVTLGASSDEFSEVLDGDISAGDLVVLNPPSSINFEEMGPGSGQGGSPFEH
jgi:HlyD family secretion protein